MAAAVMASLALKPSPFPFLDQSRLQGVQPSGRSSTFRVMAKKTKKIQTSQPFGPAGGLNLKDGVDASFPCSPIYNPEEWSPSGDVYAGGKTGLLLWAVTLAGILLGGGLLVYNTSALAS